MATRHRAAAARPASSGWPGCPARAEPNERRRCRHRRWRAGPAMRPAWGPPAPAAAPWHQPQCAWPLPPAQTRPPLRLPPPPTLGSYRRSIWTPTACCSAPQVPTHFGRGPPLQRPQVERMQLRARLAHRQCIPARSATSSKLVGRKLLTPRDQSGLIGRGWRRAVKRRIASAT
jgi:hypothetical protein